MPPAIIAPLDPFARRAGEGIELERRSVLCTSRRLLGRSSDPPGVAAWVSEHLLHTQLRLVSLPIP